MPVTLMASRPGAYTKEGLILGNPEARAVGFTPAGSYGAANLVLPVGPKYRLLSVVSDVAVDVLQVTDNETVLTASGVATPIPVPSSGQVSYSCLLHPSTVGVYVKTA